MEQNGVNYYKGVLLCSRPNQSPSVQKQKPFCGRVFPKQTLGLVPTKTYDEHHVMKRKLPVLSNHKKWLESFKKKIKDKKQEEDKLKEKQIQKLEKLKELAAQQRQKARNSESIIVQQQKSQVKPVSDNKPKVSQKPAWALTQNQAEKKQQDEVDDVLDFFQKGQVKDFSQDQQINKMLISLKNRIEQLKDKKDWKDAQVNKIKQINLQRKNPQKPQKDDILSRISKQSGSQSVASQKTAQRVQQLEKKKQQKQWDKYTKTDKKQMASVDEQIAKNVADEFLRNYPALKHHSNQSIRKLFQRQAHQYIKDDKQTKN